MRFGDPVRGSFFGWRNAFCCGVLLLSIGAIRTCAQDVAGAARQEKARKADEQRPAPHVYTEEDLRRPTILTPEDQARVEARKQQIAVPAQQNAEKTPDDPNDLNESLGEIARRYRLEIAEREAELARGKKFTAFPYDVPQKSVAAPKPGIESLAIEKPKGTEWASHFCATDTCYVAWKSFSIPAPAAGNHAVGCTRCTRKCPVGGTRARAGFASALGKACTSDAHYCWNAASGGPAWTELVETRGKLSPKWRALAGTPGFEHGHDRTRRIAQVGKHRSGSRNYHCAESYLQSADQGG